MKPIGTNNLSAWGYVGLLILFCMPYIGTPAIILFALFGNGAARNFARAILLLAVLSVVLVVALLVIGFVNLGDFNFSIDDGVQVFNSIRMMIG
ncbi:MAG: hypothetical protein J6V80_01745 [Clostridia bacterium]|nr:hypothetical protein [Clostridia bacterium]